MKTVEKWLWKIRWAGGTATTRAHQTWDEIRHAHPEAVRVENSRIEQQLPETPEEIAAAQQSPRAGR